MQNHDELICPTPVSTHFNQPGQTTNDILLIPLERIHNNRYSIRKAREAHLIDKAMTLEPNTDAINSIVKFSLYFSLSYSVMLYFKCNGHLSMYSFSFSPRRKFVLQTEISGKYI